MIDSRQKEILQLTKNLDITPSMRKDAEEKYQAISAYLQLHGIECNIYPQGSFALGTVVRPLHKDVFDLDTICELSVDKGSTTARETKESVGKVLLDSERYGDVIEYDTCWTKEYANEFNIDIVPAVDEQQEKKANLVAKAVTNKDLANQSVAITKGLKSNYRWSTSNPKGYRDWFGNINRPFLEYDRESKRQAIFAQNKALFNSVEEIPESDERSSLQIAIQILKRHRDIYFLVLNDDKDNRPISAVITTIAASIAQTLPNSLNPFELLGRITETLKIYAKLDTMEQIRFTQQYASLNLIRRDNGHWCLLNPANPDDNLLDSWNTSSGRAKAFFKWISEVVKDFEVLTSATDMDYYAAAKTVFGSDLVESTPAFTRYKESVSKTYTPIVTPAKPWKGIERVLRKY